MNLKVFSVPALGESEGHEGVFCTGDHIACAARRDDHDFPTVDRKGGWVAQPPAWS